MNDKAAAVQIKGDTYFLTTFVGSVVATDRQQSTVVSHTTNADGYRSSTSSTHTHDRLFLVSDEGKEEVYRINGAAFARNFRVIPQPDVPAAFRAQLEEIQASKANLQAQLLKLELDEARVQAKLGQLQ